MCFSSVATPGSDSPGQAIRAEEIVKQLDLNQAEEMPSSTLTSIEDITTCHTDPNLPARVQIPSSTIYEEGAIVTDTDIPPLTGEDAVYYSTSHKYITDRYTHKEESTTESICVFYGYGWKKQLWKIPTKWQQQKHSD